MSAFEALRMQADELRAEITDLRSDLFWGMVRPAVARARLEDLEDEREDLIREFHLDYEYLPAWVKSARKVLCDGVFEEE